MSPALSHAQTVLFTARAPLPTTARLLVAAAVVVTKWDRNRRSRRHLAALDGHLLTDIGLTPGAARSEAARPFWQG